jgi:hypothetical protein
MSGYKVEEDVRNRIFASEIKVERALMDRASKPL